MPPKRKPSKISEPVASLPVRQSRSRKKAELKVPVETQEELTELSSPPRKRARVASRVVNKAQTKVSSSSPNQEKTDIDQEESAPKGARTGRSAKTKSKDPPPSSSLSPTAAAPSRKAKASSSSGGEKSKSIKENVPKEAAAKAIDKKEVRKGHPKNRKALSSADDNERENPRPSSRVLQDDLATLPMILDQSQRSLALHRRALQAAIRLHEADPTGFTEQFVRLIQPVLLVKKREPSVERVIQFLVLFATSTTIPAIIEDQQVPFCNFFIDFCLSFSNSKNNAVRFRTTQLVAFCLKALPEDFEIE